MCYPSKMLQPLSAVGLILSVALVLPLGAQENSFPSDLIPIPPFSEPQLRKTELLLEEVLLARPDLSQEVQEALKVLPREHYVPEDLASLAYHNRTLPLGDGLFLPAPSDLGAVIDHLELSPSDRVLVVGAGAGYSAELIALLAAEVVLVEKSSRERERILDLRASGERSWDRENLTILEDWTLTPLLTQKAFDAVFVHGGVVRIPEPLFALLAPTARMAVPLRGYSGFTLLSLYETSPIRTNLRVYEELFFPKILEW